MRNGQESRAQALLGQASQTNGHVIFTSSGNLQPATSRYTECYAAWYAHTTVREIQEMPRENSK